MFGLSNSNKNLSAKIKDLQNLTTGLMLNINTCIINEELNWKLNFLQYMRLKSIETAQRKCCISYLCSCYLCTGVSILKPPVKFNLVECHKVELSLNTISQEPVSHQC